MCFIHILLFIFYRGERVCFEAQRRNTRSKSCQSR